jgi:hypothetical protein
MESRRSASEADAQAHRFRAICSSSWRITDANDDNARGRVIECITTTKFTSLDSHSNRFDLCVGYCSNGPQVGMRRYTPFLPWLFGFVFGSGPTLQMIGALGRLQWLGL